MKCRSTIDTRCRSVVEVQGRRERSAEEENDLLSHCFFSRTLSSFLYDVCIRYSRDKSRSIRECIAISGISGLFRDPYILINIRTVGHSMVE
jgi:hypothetical protein